MNMMYIILGSAEFFKLNFACRSDTVTEPDVRRTEKRWPGPETMEANERAHLTLRTPSGSDEWEMCKNLLFSELEFNYILTINILICFIVETDDQSS